MKNRYLAGLIGVLFLYGQAAHAQAPVPVRQSIPDKPLLFSQFPEKSYCEEHELLQVFQAVLPSNVNITLQGGQILRGVVVDKVERNTGRTSINIKLVDYRNALLNLTLQHTTKKINGRVVHPGSGDVLIVAEENGRYFLKKQLQKFFMTE